MNPSVSCASSVPVVSTSKKTPYAYCIGKRGPPAYPAGLLCIPEHLPELMKDIIHWVVAPNTSICGTWTVEALNWETGVSEFHVDLGSSMFFNPLFAATEIGAGGSMVAGAFGGFYQV